MSADYTTVGHVTVDVLADGSRRPGGTALYSALQAARLGLRAEILTRGVHEEIESLLEPYRHELTLRIEPADQTTTLLTLGEGPARRQRVLGWAGPMQAPTALGSAIVHLAPVAAELPFAALSSYGFIGLTPQGLVRRWSGPDAEIIAAGPAPEAAIELAGSCHAMVLSEAEREGCEPLIEAAAGRGAVVAITAGEAPTTLLDGRSAPRRVAVDALARPVEDIGAGDVYASAFFICLHEARTPAQAAAFASAAAAERMLGSGVEAIAPRAAIEARLAR